MRISTQLDISEIQTTADSIEISMRKKIRHAITSARRSTLEFSRHARRSPPLGRGSAFGVWLERRAELEKSIVEFEFYKNYSQNIGHTVEIVKVVLKRRSAMLVLSLRNRIETSQHSKRKVLSSIGEDMRDLYLLRFLLAMTHTEIQYDRI